ncbi:MAG: polyprenyl synthetase family protein [Candidatus Dadabacteria bacterium]|nr:polyprenyl synthetase family protein [Candidatus Dadabacteria bacterium]MYA47718.1 polyprenyl synthetase family protein [Candidatus Dadabacteria bacterium]MYG83329.1 polyprenyl synthetase family protein [Candidatus Dadabacteria bacterium]MYK50114.1 polyprenyl synthetase family protein [Candidatus Dadabacteria bacterium]
MSFDTKDYLDKRKEIVDHALREYLPPDEVKTKLHQSILYSIHPGGKRLRPILCLAASELICGSYKNALPAACAIEMIHTYSIIHDDLPSMDDDDTRRGKPANHRVFGEAVATLAGDALLTDAFNLITEKLLGEGVSSELILRVISIISEASGSKGMVLGQTFDLEMDGSEYPSVDEILNAYIMKTAKMITASVLSGAVLAGAEDEELLSLKSYSERIGIAFQIKDDLLDVKENCDTTQEPGDKSGTKKHTYVSVMGVEASKAKVSELTNQAIAELESFRKTPNPLKEIAAWLSEREE